MSTQMLDPSLSERAVAWLSTRLGRHDDSRRRFLFRLAVVGSALSVNPIQYILRPVSAYASVCGSGASCSSGWTAFCCTINDPAKTGQPAGANTCPDYSYVAGWWKVDASSFCNGSARYYVDCNTYEECAPESEFDSCSARCADGPCDHRRWCTNCFRYGQCNTQIRGTGRVVCRIITCTPPWVWDPACSTTVRTSETTRTHSASCLPGENPSVIEMRYLDMGLTGSILGAPTTSERSTTGGGRRRDYRHGSLVGRDADEAILVYADFATAWYGQGGEEGALGYPTGEAREDGRGRYQLFERGIVARTGSVANAVGGRIGRRYLELGGPGGRLGLPTSDEVATVDGRARVSFEGGAILRSGSSLEVLYLGRGRSPSDLPGTSRTSPSGGRSPSQLP
jgi:hypothetical protein